MAQQLNSTDFDDMDVIMSQMDLRILESDGASGGEKQQHEKFIKEMMDEELDTIDEAMSQIDTEIFNQVDVAADIDVMSIPEALIEKYEEAMNEIDDKMVEQMKQEPDVDADTSVIPQELLAEYEKAIGGILPVKSTDRYLQAYNAFTKWQASHHTESFHEKVILAYFSVASEKYQPPTLWSMYSMLKKTLIWKHNVDLSKCCQLRAFLKTSSDGYEGKQAKVFTPAELHKFFVQAPNVVYLGMKVVMIFGVVGACRGIELTNLTTDLVKDNGNDIEVSIPITKNKEKKYYVIGGEFAKIIREYMTLRSPHTTNNRFFVQFRNGKCVNQVMGKHSIARIPKEVAKFLKLDEPAKYSVHSYRRTGTTIAADAGASVEDLKRLGPWKSTKVCEMYIQQSLEYKRKLGNMITGAINFPSTSKAALSDRTNTQREFEKDVIPEPVILVPSDFSMSHVNDTIGTENKDQVNGSKIATSGKLLPETVTFDINPNKENVIFHFSGSCSNFSIINKK